MFVFPSWKQNCCDVIHTSHIRLLIVRWPSASEFIHVTTSSHGELNCRTSFTAKYTAHEIIRVSSKQNPASSFRDSVRVDTHEHRDSTVFLFLEVNCKTTTEILGWHIQDHAQWNDGVVQGQINHQHKFKIKEDMVSWSQWAFTVSFRGWSLTFQRDMLLPSSEKIMYHVPQKCPHPPTDYTMSDHNLNGGGHVSNG
jgi:hypothetical protein